MCRREEAGRLRCNTPAFVISVNVQMKLMKGDIGDLSREERWGEMQGEDLKKTETESDLVALLKGQGNQTGHAVL